MVLDSPPVNPAAMPSSPGERPEMDPAREDSHAAGRLTAIPVSSRSQAPETLDFPLPVGDDRTESLQIPVYDPSSWPRSSTSSRRAILTEDQEQALQQQGYRVRRTRQVVAVPVRDGASVLVPVDAYGLQYEIQ